MENNEERLERIAQSRFNKGYQYLSPWAQTEVQAEAYLAAQPNVTENEAMLKVTVARLEQELADMKRNNEELWLDNEDLRRELSEKEDDSQ